jgi:hypothetical protein
MVVFTLRLLHPLKIASSTHWIGGWVDPQPALSKGLNRVGASLPSPEDGMRFSFRNVVFSSYLVFRTMGKVHKPSNFEGYMLFCIAGL